MSTNEKYRAGDKVSLPVPSGTTAGTPLRIGGLNGITATDRARTEGLSPFNDDGSANSTYNRGGGNIEGNASVWLDGAHDVPVDTTTALAVGDPVYITSGNVLTPVATGNSLFGHALSAKGTTAGETVTVRITN